MNDRYLDLLKHSLEFEIEPPSIDEALDSDYYLKNFFPFVYPFWRKKLRELFPNNVTTSSTYVLFTGSISGGKSTISQIIILYDLIKICCMRDFAHFNQIMMQNGAALKCMNVYKWKADDFANTLRDAVFGGKVPFFQRQIDSGNEFLKGLRIEACGPREDQLVSADVPIFWLSEMNKIKPEKAISLINSADSRLTGRFINSENIFTHLIIDSSTTDSNDSTETWIKTDPKADRAFIVRVNAWNTREGLGTYFNYGSFEVYLGDSQRNPFIVPKEFSLPDRLKLDQDRFLICPNELKEEAERDIILFIQEKCGISISSSFKFFSNLKKLGDAFTIQKEYDDVLIVDFFDPSDTIMSKVRKDIEKLPLDRKLYIRLDCGISHDLYGVAVGYADGIDSLNIDGIPTERMKIKIPIVFAVSRYSNQETPINKVEDFVLQLSENYSIGHVWMDQFQCFTGDTKIALLEGTDIPIKDIVERFNKGDVMYTYTLDTEKGKLTAGKIINAWCTGKKRIVEVTLDNNEVIRCTEDHRFMMRDGSFKEARYLQPNESLMPLYRYNNEKGYEVVLNPINDSWGLTYGKIQARKEWEAKNPEKARLNHKVKLVRFTDEVEEVYDLTIDNFPNFALSAGVFVHNSVGSKQLFIQHGLEADIKSSDRTDSNYVTTKNYIYNGLVEIADNNLAYKEMSELERVSPTKIDRVRDGVSHKDASDCIVHLIGEMVNLGPEECLAVPESQVNDEVVDAYRQLSDYRNKKYSAHGYISDYL